MEVKFPSASALHEMSNKELVGAYNSLAKQAGRKTTKRFASADQGVSRVLGLIAEIKGGDKAAPAKAKTRTQVLGERAAREYKASKSNKRAKANGHAKTATPRRAAPKSTPDGHRAYKDKERKAANKAYLPRPGSIQAKLYDHLKAAGSKGTQVDKLCDFLNTIRRGAVPITRANLWTEITFILCYKRGYGLRAADERVSIIIPKEERDHNGQ